MIRNSDKTKSRTIWSVHNRAQKPHIIQKLSVIRLKQEDIRKMRGLSGNFLRSPPVLILNKVRFVSESAPQGIEQPLSCTCFLQSISSCNQSSVSLLYNLLQYKKNHKRQYQYKSLNYSCKYYNESNFFAWTHHLSKLHQAWGQWVPWYTSFCPLPVIS